MAPLSISTDAAAEAYRYPLLLKHLLHYPLAAAPGQEIVYRDRMRYSYRDFAARIGRLASALAGLGVECGDVAAVMDWDSHRYLECYFAVPMMGAVLQTVNWRLSTEQILYTLNHSGAKTLLVHQDFLPLLEQFRQRLTKIGTIVLLQDSPASAPDHLSIAGNYEELLDRASDRFEFPDFDEGSLATTFYTTGTTGPPKAVGFSHRQLVLHTLAVLGAFASAADGQSFRRSDVYMPLTPMFHVHAWGFPYVATALGVKQVYPGKYEPPMLLALRGSEGVSFSHCVPTVLQMLIEAAHGCDADLRGWKLAIGGASLSVGLAERAVASGLNVFAAYGMSETCPVLTVARVEDIGAGPGSPDGASLCKAGIPIPLVELRLVDEQMRDSSHDGVGYGEIVVRAPWLTLAYRGEPEASERLWRGGYLHTQDIGATSQGGELEIRDRMKDVIKSGGEWISSLALEDLISRHAGVAEVAVIAVPDATWGERPLALVVPTGEWRDRLTDSDVREHLARLAQEGLIPRYALPQRIRLVDSLARTSVGKLDKKRLREQFAAEEAGPP